jgi:hypothetical protein
VTPHPAARLHRLALLIRQPGIVLIWSAVLALIVFRSAQFVFRQQLAFDSDQAVFGLMAKHLIEGRAFPVFMYGQNYILGVEAWLAAPVFLMAGVSAAALKFPLLLVNAAVGLLLVTLISRQTGLGRGAALAASLFFVLAPPGTAATLLQASGGNVEPFLYVLLLWLTRHRPLWFGLILGIGFLQREFTAYGAVAIVAIALVSGAWHGRQAWQRAGQALRVAVEVWLVAQILQWWASARGPGTDVTAITSLGTNLTSAAGRFCFDPGAITGGLTRLVTVHWPRLFGTARLPAVDFGLESATHQGLPWSGLVLGALMVLFAVRIAAHARFREAWWKQYEFCVFLVMVGALSAGVFAAGRCGDVTIMRYDLLSIFGGVGLAAWGLAVESRPWIRRAEIALLVAWAIVSATAHAQIWSEYMRHPRVADKILIIRSLDARGIRYATSDYWIAYYVTFLTNERIIVASDFARILSYEQQVDAHRAMAIRISRAPCGDTKPAIDGVYFCPLP